jgi:hypothetical protein
MEVSKRTESSQRRQRVQLVHGSHGTQNQDQCVDEGSSNLAPSQSKIQSLELQLHESQSRETEKYDHESRATRSQN